MRARICVTDDPYDIWKTGPGFLVKDLYNRHRRIGLLPAAVLTLCRYPVEQQLPAGATGRRSTRWFAPCAALALLNLHEREASPHLLTAARRHLDWLRENASPGYSGPCWGIGFRQPIQAGLIYEADLPLSTMTPYPLEAFVRFHRLAGDDSVVPVIRGIYGFFSRDLKVMEETDEYLVTSYGAMRDRRVVNAVELCHVFVEPAASVPGPG